MTIDTKPRPGSTDADAGAPGGGIGMKAVRAAYRRYAPLYDMVFGRFLDRGRRAAVAAIGGAPERRVLEIGVGTGLSLPLYSPSARVTGIDVSAEMLEKARHRAALLRLAQVEDLVEMDAEAMDFPDHRFDVVVAMYVLSVTPRPSRLLDEMRRVCAPGGDILVVNRFTSEKPLRRMAERMAAPLSAAIGFNTEFDACALEVLDGLTFVEDRPLPGLSGARLLHWRNGPKAL